MLKRVAFIALATAISLGAQSGVPAKQAAEAGFTTSFGPIGIQAAMAGPAATVEGAPYTAEAVTERVQTLADGNRIVQTTTSSVARDSQGRVHREESLAIGLPGQPGSAPKLVMIEDPVAGVHWTLDSNKKIAVKLPFPKALNPALAKPGIPAPGPDTFFFAAPGPAPGAGPFTIQAFAKGAGPTDANVNRTDLGTQTMEGVSAQGTRITRTLAAGSVGNEQPIVITTETWNSPELKVLVMSRVEDPRMGTTTYRLTNIQRVEPPPSLFEIPSDYTVKEQPNNVVVYKDQKNQ